MQVAMETPARPIEGLSEASEAQPAGARSQQTQH
jgi:hypothetical protein